ncbi:hypothetical protein, conserved [Trypanosoma cruzi]|uniref:Flagellar attachment zone protein 1 conserved domain-containing protein n=1 Tax=Trypanosoma cruzi (strain CL Brener) TaxID=353153 RepID=Q4DJH2_TRYCC|nr:hypothetical protein, conserved [Trypanosoma cruzi]EAN92665.1 hypothetical protein, conserved [Trypanosoma cruzi]|eukprot:XP_814516.1 hypothetical protein [Trypanosoma cruzi strain CL Brener]
MRRKTSRKHDNATLTVSLNGICKQADFLLLACIFHKLKNYVQLRQQDTHLKRCAVLLKHQAIKKIVTDHFIRWLGNTQRQISIRSGQREPTKIVVLPRAQDFINLGLRYLARWRLWLRYLRQRQHRNVTLLYDKVTEVRHHKFFFKWYCFLSEGQKKSFLLRIHNLESENMLRAEYIAELENTLQKQNKSINNLTKDAEKLQEQKKKQQTEIKCIKEAMEMAITKLEKKSTEVPGTKTLHAAEEMARYGDDVPLRLLTSCTDAANALEKLRKALPDGFVSSGGKEGIADVICQQTKALQGYTSRMENELAALRSSDKELRQLVEDLRAHDERWELNPKRTARAAKTHQKRQLEGSDWGTVLRSRPVELQRALITDAADACHVEPECITNVVMAADGLLSFDVQHDPSVSAEELSGRVNEYPFRTVRRVYQRRTAPKDGLDLLEEQLAEKEQKVVELREFMEMAVTTLGNPDAAPRVSEVRSAAEEMARYGDDVPLRLLTSCTDAANALEKLRKALPDGFVSSGGKEGIADVICQQTKALQGYTSRMENELAALRSSDKELRQLVEDLRAHDERWELNPKRTARAAKTHQKRQLEGSDWGTVLRSRPVELQRALITDAADACHVEPECITNVVMAADGLLSFDVQHDPSVSAEELSGRVNEYPFRTVRRVYQRRTAPKDGLDLLEEQLAEKEQKVVELREFMEMAVTTLGNPDAAPRVSEVRSAAEEMARYGDDVPLRLLTSCTDAANALEKLRKALPDGFVSSGGKEGIADVICQQTKALQGYTSRMENELAALRSSDKELRQLVEDLRAHDERWELNPKRTARAAKTHQKRQLEGSDWGTVLRSRPVELQRALITDAADACHVEPECITNVVMAADGLLSFDVQHDPSVSAEELSGRVNEYPFRTVRRVYQRRTAPKDGLDLLEEQLAEKEQKVVELREFMEMAVTTLGNPDAAPRVSEVRSAAEEMARYGDDVPLRLLTSCTDAANALEKLRKALPDGFVSSGEFDSIVDVACNRAAELNDKVVQLLKELQDSKSFAVFLREVLQEAASRILVLANYTPFSHPPSLFKTFDEKVASLSWCGSEINLDAFEGSPDARDSLDVVKDHLLQDLSLTANGPSTAGVLRSFNGALGQMYEMLTRCKKFFLEQERLAGQEGEKRVLLVKAVKDAVAALQGWSVASGGFATEGMDELQLVTDMRQESEVASNTLARLRQLLSGKAVGKKVGSGSLNELHGDESLIVQLPVIETHEDLLNAVSKVYDRLQEVGQAYNDIYSAFIQFVPEPSPIINDMSWNVSCVAPPTSLSYDPVKRAEFVIRGMHSYIEGKGREVKELRGVMRRGIVALGGAEESDTDDDLMDQRRSAAKSTAVGEKLAVLCRETGDAIEDTRKALGLPNEGKLRLPAVISNLEEKMQELDLVTMESALLVREVRSTHTDTQESSSNLSRNLRPKRKPAALVVDDLKSGWTNAVRPLHPSLSSAEAGTPNLKPDELLRQMRIELQDKNAEIRELFGACRTVVSLLDGSYKANVQPPQCEGALVPLLTTQAEELERALRLAEEVISSFEVQGTSGVGNYLTLLASQLASLRIEKEKLQEEMNKHKKENTQLVTEFNEEISCLKKQNEILLKRLKSLQEKLGALEKLRHLRAKEMMEILRLRTVKEHLGRSVILWLGKVVATCTAEARGAANEQKRLSIAIVQKQHQQNQLAKLLAIALHSLPGEKTTNADVLDTENALIQCALEDEGAALEAFARKRLDAAKVWMQSFLRALSSVVSLRADTVALRQLIANCWRGRLEEAYGQVLNAAFKEIADFDKQKKMECDFLRNRARDREEIARENRSLSCEIAGMKEQLGLAQDYMALQDEKIIKLQRENRDLRIGGVLRREEKESNTSTDATPSKSLRGGSGVERIMIARAKKLALEAINAMAGKNLAACIGEVAELTLEMYRRTSAALEDVYNAQNAPLGPLSAVVEARLQELQNMRGVQNDIVARLPELFRVPYVN